MRTTALLLPAVLLLTACGGGDGGGGASGGTGDGIVSYAHSVGPTTLDPAGIGSLQEVLYLNPVYDRLVYLDPVTGDASPMLATDWEIGSDEQGGYVDFTLQQGLTFPDGAPFDSSTVVANVERSRSMAGSTVAAQLADVTGVEAVDPATVRLRAASGAAWLPNIMGGPAGMMISQDALDNSDLATAPVGIGMWTLERFDPSVVTYSATPDYWDPEAQAADNLELRFIADDNARFNAIRSGDIDTTFIRPSQLSEAESAGIEVIEVPGATTYAYHFNTSVDGLNNLAVRQALQKAIDRDAIVEQLLGGQCASNDQLWSPALSAYDEDAPTYDYDPEAARAELVDAGYGSGLQLRLATADIDQYRRLAEIIQAQWGEVGVEVSLQVVPASSLRELFAIRKEADVALGNTGLEADPSQLYTTYIAPDGLMNPGGGEVPGAQELAEKALAVADADEREALYEEISSLARENAGYLSVCSPDFLYATSDVLTGFTGARAAGLPEFRGVGEE